MYLSEKVIHRPGSTQYGISGQIGFCLPLSEKFIHLDQAQQKVKDAQTVFVSFYRRGSFIRA